MSGHECYHCKQWIEDDEAHDCWTTTERALTKDLSEDLQDAWERLRETAAEFGPQRIYASHNSIMFSRKACYVFVRPKRTHLEVCIFLDRRLRAPQIHKVDRSSKTKFYHLLRITHRDQVEAPITDWLQDAYGLEDRLVAEVRKKKEKGRRQKQTSKSKNKKKSKKKTRPASRS